MDSLRKPPESRPPAPMQPLYVPRPEKAWPEPAFPPLLKPREIRRSRKPFFWRALLVALIALSLLAVSALVFLGYKGLRLSESIRIENSIRPSFLSQIRNFTGSFIAGKRMPLRGEDDGRINILLLGRAGEHYPGRNLTDTVMMMSIDTEQKKVALLSLPRDLYAPIPDTDLYTKINSLYQYGISAGDDIDPVRRSVEEITGQTLHYFVVLDFDGFEKAVDALGGISVDIVRDFYDTRYPGKNYSYETFEIKKGWQTLDGSTALKYVRERHDDPEGDFGRAKRQQQIIQAIKDKAFSVGTFLNVFVLDELLDALGESVKTDMELEDMERFLTLSKTLDTENVITTVVDAWKKDSLLRVSHIQVGPIAAFILVPRVGNWSEIRDLSENIFHLDAIEKRTARISSEQPALAILYQKGDAALAQKLSRLAEENMDFDTVSLIPIDTLENRPEQSIIVDRSGLAKPYSLDELLKKFPLRKADSLPAGIVFPDGASDFVIVIGDSLADTLDFEENDVSNIPDDAAFPEILPPQPRKKDNF